MSEILKVCAEKVASELGMTVSRSEETSCWQCFLAGQMICEAFRLEELLGKVEAIGKYQEAIKNG